jgi:hypothetical protein
MSPFVANVVQFASVILYHIVKMSVSTVEVGQLARRFS